MDYVIPPDPVADSELDSTSALALALSDDGDAVLAVDRTNRCWIGDRWFSTETCCAGSGKAAC